MVPLEQLDGIKDIMGEEANVQYMFIVCANVKLANGEGDLERYVECSHPSLLQAIGATRHDTGRVVLTHSLTQTLYSVTKPEVEMSVGGSRYVCVCVCVCVSAVSSVGLPAIISGCHVPSSSMFFELTSPLSWIAA